jgi:hypothetical protein
VIFSVEAAPPEDFGTPEERWVRADLLGPLSPIPAAIQPQTCSDGIRVVGALAEMHPRLSWRLLGVRVDGTGDLQQITVYRVSARGGST